jgi:two-component system sensor histidine kinase KdpD
VSDLNSRFIPAGLHLSCNRQTVEKRPLQLLNQYFLGLLAVACVTALGLGLYALVGHRVVAFMFLFTISFLALFIDIRPLVTSAFLSALVWDFLFIPPRFTLTVGDTEDRLLLATYFFVVMIHAVLTYRVRAVEKEVRRKEAKANAIKFYNTLLNSLSHELRTPITTIIGATDNLQTNGKIISTADREMLLSEISSASLRLNQQVENLLNMSRIESGTFEIRKDWVDVRELIYGSIQRFEPVISKWKVTVNIPDQLPLFRLDFALMETAIHNIVGNVIQHTSEGTDISMRADCLDDKLILSVADTGKGFPHADIEKVFDKFYRVKGSRPGGTGLGLSIVKGFVEAHHGTVHLRNLPLIGAELTIEIPTEVSYLSGLKNE